MGRYLFLVCVFLSLCVARGKYVERLGHNKTYFFSESMAQLNVLRDRACGQPEVRRSDQLCCPLTVNDEEERAFLAEHGQDGYVYWIGLYCIRSPDCRVPTSSGYRWLRDDSDFREPSFQPRDSRSTFVVMFGDSGEWFYGNYDDVHRFYVCEFESECASEEHRSVAES